MELVRLNKHLAHRFGISRREADLRIEQGRVLVNGKVASIGNVIDPRRDSITLDDTKAAFKRYTYVLMNKPVGYVCSRKKQGENPTIYELLPREYQHLKVAGRLDKDSCGLLLLTDDGDTIFKLTHPKFGKEKVYHVGLNKPLKPEDKKRIETGVDLEDGPSKLSVSVIPAPDRSRGQASAGIQKKPNMYKITMHEGRNRQIRRTFKELGYTVTYLERIQFAQYKHSLLKNALYLRVYL
jgi:23S rRNA pseudouridine2605 synthase